MDMRGSVRESDWRRFRELAPAAAERRQLRCLQDIAALAADDSMSAYDRYVAAWELMEECEEEVNRGFGQMRRAAALQQITYCFDCGMFTEEELGTFTEETQETVKRWLNIEG